MIAGEDQLRVQDGTAHRDYILKEYTPRVDPTGRLQPVSLFRHELRQHGWLEPVWPVCEALRGAVGVDNTVWAVKYGADGIGVEFYLYNNRDNAPPGPLSVEPVARALAPLGRFPQLCEERLPYFMWSFEVTPEELAEGRLGAIRLYLASGEEGRQPSGFSLRLEGGGSVLENHYSFYRPERELADAKRRIARSIRSGRPEAWRGLLPDYLEDCYTICYAVKPRRDGIYFARISSAQLGRFLGQVHKQDIARVLEHHADDFAHCVWDLGVDFAMAESADRTEILKMAIHGVL